jgi:hypothetical protein
VAVDHLGQLYGAGRLFDCPLPYGFVQMMPPGCTEPRVKDKLMVSKENSPLPLGNDMDGRPCLMCIAMSPADCGTKPFSDRLQWISLSSYAHDGSNRVVLGPFPDVLEDAVLRRALNFPEKARRGRHTVGSATAN